MAMPLLRARPRLELGSRVVTANGATSAVAKANATTYWQKANDHADKLDRALVSALARQMIGGKPSRQEAQSRLDDWIDVASNCFEYKRGLRWEFPTQPSCASVPGARPSYLRMPQPTGPQAAAELGPPELLLVEPNRLRALLTCSLPQLGQMIASLLNIERRKRSKSSPQSLQ
jgi:hypothetical protein